MCPVQPAHAGAGTQAAGAPSFPISLCMHAPSLHQYTGGGIEKAPLPPHIFVHAPSELSLVRHGVCVPHHQIRALGPTISLLHNCRWSIARGRLTADGGGPARAQPRRSLPPAPMMMILMIDRWYFSSIGEHICSSDLPHTAPSPFMHTRPKPSRSRRFTVHISRAGNRCTCRCYRYSSRCALHPLLSSPPSCTASCCSLLLC